MSKFSKKSLAVLTTAAIMASTASVVAYAATASSVKVGEGIKSVASSDGASTITDGNTSVDAETYIITLESGYENPTVTIDGTPKEITNNQFTLAKDDITGCAIVISATKKSGGSEPTPAGEENSDYVVWVNGKDNKASKDGKTPASLYKTESFDKVMMSAGGKWQVAVTDTTVTKVEDFVKLFDDKGKFDKTTASKMKQIASAKIKEGTVTVTAGKSAGMVNVWVYEVKNKKVVASTVEGNAFYGKLEGDVAPEPVEFTVKVAPGMVTTTEATKVKDGVVENIATAKKLKKSYKAGDEVIVYFGDKKNAVSTDATYVLWDGKNKAAAKLDESGKLVVADAYTAELVQPGEAGPAVKITIDAKATDKTKIDVQVKNIESGKVAKISPKVAKVTVPKEEKFTLTVADGIKVSVAGAEQTLTEGKIELAKGTKVTFDVDVTIGETDITAGTEYEVTANVSVAVKAAA